ncbi:MAG: hypothetical protein RIS51_456, partial [Actinomycetota bacterium]
SGDDRRQREEDVSSPIQGMLAPESTPRGNSALGQVLDLLFELVVFAGRFNSWVTVFWIDSH